MATEAETQPPSVDETPISPVRSTERRNSLEKHLQHRPDVQELKDRHILLDTNAAPALQQKQLELERQKISDNLKKGLAHRPDRETLVERHILPDSNAAPALQAHQIELERNMKADHLENALKSRPAPDELVNKGILSENPTAAS
ncbi:hypothetical protein GTA08_BOTSDO04776 [Neofusicoccum parvum]|uniref:Uncharacterized protein n=1 Tax=Neofusicoccum parvum TaxID=310453 RepID=A0ACB5S1E3_9PEZI|nr:hypothetical protein GTA08_BOTSDO04776 [Neofusicoccum parvum]GME65631.1 hypothetical protein GTA08_BOTSDO04776 [Neofusicoccum parvum]